MAGVPSYIRIKTSTLVTGTTVSNMATANTTSWMEADTEANSKEACSMAEESWSHHQVRKLQQFGKTVAELTHLSILIPSVSGMNNLKGKLKEKRALVGARVSLSRSQDEQE